MTMATQFEIDCALMAGASYISTRKPLNQFPIPSEWTEQIVERAADDTGFEATCFTKGTELVISYAGTYDKDIAGDIAADVGLATGFGSIQLLQAAEYYLSLKNDPRYQGYNITLTGHSLGGGLAALIGVLFGVMTITFDQAPFASSAISGQPDVAAKLKTDLLASGHTETELAGLSNFLQLTVASLIQRKSPTTAWTANFSPASCHSPRSIPSATPLPCFNTGHPPTSWD